MLSFFKKEVFSRFRWWKRKRVSKYLGMFLLISSAVVMVLIVLGYAGFETFEKADLIFGLVSISFFQLIAFYQLFLCLQLSRKKMEHYWIGTVNGKFKEKYPNKRVKSYHITADVSGETVCATCLKRSYNIVQPGQNILLFSIGTTKVYCVHFDK